MQTIEEQVVLVNEQDEPMGLMSKWEAHKQGLLHRAISVFILNSRGEMLLQKRALDKYHSSGLWSNTCCSHPYHLEDTLQAAQRRLEQEMGLTTPLSFLFSFIYQEELDNNLTEYEFDHVFIGIDDKFPIPNPEEVAEYRYQKIPDILHDMELHSDQYTIWFKICLPRVYETAQEKGLIAAHS